MTQSRRRRGRRPTRPLSPSHISNAPVSVTNRELAFRQLTEQLWAAGLPSAQTACSMSVRSRCSSAPPSERGGGGGTNNDLTSMDWNNEYDDGDDDENMIEWDAPGKPDDGNSRRRKKFIHAYIHIIYYIVHTHTHDASMILSLFFSITHA